LSDCFAHLCHLTDNPDWKWLHQVQVILAVLNVTVHPSKVSVPIILLLYSNPLMCAFMSPIIPA